jgi:hypothetical protein
MNLTFYVIKNKGLEFGLDMENGRRNFSGKHKKSLTKQGQAFCLEYLLEE